MARPQDLGTGILLAASQVKEMIETGGGMKQEQSVEILGQQMNGGMQMGFGEVMQPMSGALETFGG
ncbi:uncharacterized protein Dwil_GK25264 [Drosophila willistoni]|uniref:Uncharacterized protein n=1 Tax=Drosophila willistoni TaxID=7260 RepID=B4NEL1_DROWI|nr:uncharacterized protein Dwil_GK25264 [Drosophila willistoni]